MKEKFIFLLFFFFEKKNNFSKAILVKYLEIYQNLKIKPDLL